MSPIIDGFNQEVISHNISKSPNLEQINDMLNKAFDKTDNKELEDLIKAIDDYINYYNYDRIKEKLKGLSPVNYRLQSSN